MLLYAICLYICIMPEKGIKRLEEEIISREYSPTIKDISHIGIGHLSTLFSIIIKRKCIYCEGDSIYPVYDPVFDMLYK